MNVSHSAAADVARSATTPRLFVLNVSAGLVLSMAPDGKDQQGIASHCRIPDGVAIDADAGHVYWSNMGVPNADDGTIVRADLDGEPRHPRAEASPTRPSSSTSDGDRQTLLAPRGHAGDALQPRRPAVRPVVGDPRPTPPARQWCVGIAVDPQAGRSIDPEGLRQRCVGRMPAPGSRSA